MSIDALLIYPRLGSMDSVVVDLPLSILYAAADSVKQGRAVELMDCRLTDDWRTVVDRAIGRGVKLVGLSVMTGHPLKHAREISLYVRQRSPMTPVVWGGPHGTVLPDTIQEPFIDFLVRGYGSSALAALIAKLGDGGEDFGGIPGLSWKKAGLPVHNDRPPFHESVSFRDIPYHLLDVDHPGYQRSYLGVKMFGMFTSIGCPYQCTFCVHPTIYKVINPPKWVPLPDEEVLGHMEMAVERFKARHICILDDTSFPDLTRMRRIFEEILRRNLDVILEFRGARINELDRMDEDFINLMIRAGVRVLKVGAESASDRLLRTFNKKITKEQILRVNRKFAKHPELVMDYNFFCGAPGETYEDLKETKDAVLEIIAGNPQALYSFGSDWKPIPGSKMLEVAERDFGFVSPKTFDDWIEMDSFDAKRKIVHPWYTQRHNNLIKLMQMAAFVIDDKVIKGTRANTTLAFRLFRALARLYKPIAMFRLRRNFTAWMLEFEIYQFVLRMVPKLTRGSKQSLRRAT